MRFPIPSRFQVFFLEWFLEERRPRPPLRCSLETEVRCCFLRSPAVYFVHGGVELLLVLALLGIAPAIVAPIRDSHTALRQG